MSRWEETVMCIIMICGICLISQRELFWRLIYPAATILYDYAITFAVEVGTVWRRKISLASVAILTNRYALLGLGSSFLVALLPIDGNHVTELVRYCDSLSRHILIFPTSAVLSIFYARLNYLLREYASLLGVQVPKSLWPSSYSLYAYPILVCL